MLTSNISVNLLDIILYKQQKSGKVRTYPRSFSALSFRIDSENEFFFGSKRISANSGSIALIPEGIDYERVAKKDEAVVFHFKMFGDIGRSIEVFYPADPSKYQHLFSKAIDIWEKKEPGFKYKATAIFYEILYMLQCDGEIKQSDIMSNGERTAIIASEHIDLHFADPEMSVSAIAELLYISESYLRRVFEKYFGISPKKYLDSVRISHACSLIDSGLFTQKEIAQRCGFGDVKYFRTVFRKKMGMAPSEYKYIF